MSLCGTPLQPPVVPRSVSDCGQPRWTTSGRCVIAAAPEKLCTRAKGSLFPPSPCDGAFGHPVVETQLAHSLSRTSNLHFINVLPHRVSRQLFTSFTEGCMTAPMWNFQQAVSSRLTNSAMSLNKCTDWTREQTWERFKHVLLKNMETATLLRGLVYFSLQNPLLCSLLGKSSLSWPFETFKALQN